MAAGLYGETARFSVAGLWNSKVKHCLSLDLLSRRVWREDEPVELSSREFGLLEMFLRNPGQVLGRQQILASLWDYSFDPGSNVVDVYVRHLRKKIDRPGGPSLIETVRGAGYRFEPGNKDLP